MNKEAKSKVFIGPIEIANVAKGLADALQSNGIDADFVTYSTSKHPFGYKTDKVLFFFQESPIRGVNRLLRAYHFVKLLFKYNTYVFLSPKSLLNKNRDLWLLRFLGKKIVFFFTGCAERSPQFDVTNPNFICNRCKDDNWKKMFLCNELQKKAEKIRYFEKYADYIIAAPDSAAYLNNTKSIWPFIISEEPPEKDYLLKFSSQKIKIVHMPSNPLVKQSHIIIPVLEMIANLENVEVIIKEGFWERTRMLSVLDSAHILVDAIGLGYGMLGVEGMSRGCVVLNSFDDWFRQNVPDAPIYRTSSETLYNDILYLINNRETLRDYARRSLEFYHRFHSPKAAGKYYKEKLQLK